MGERALETSLKYFYNHVNRVVLTNKQWPHAPCWRGAWIPIAPSYLWQLRGKRRLPVSFPAFTPWGGGYSPQCPAAHQWQRSGSQQQENPAHTRGAGLAFLPSSTLKKSPGIFQPEQATLPSELLRLLLYVYWVLSLSKQCWFLEWDVIVAGYVYQHW